MKKNTYYFIIIILLVFSGSANAKTLKKVTLLLQWTPQAQFAGIYMAEERKIFEKYGLDVNVIHANANEDSLDILIDEKVDFATSFLISGIIKNSKKKPIVNICQIVNKSNVMLIAWKNKNINSIYDMNGAKVSTWYGSIGFPVVSIFKDYKIDIKKYTQTESISLFAKGGVDVCSAMLYNEYNLLYYAGIDYDEINTFTLSDYGYNFPEDAIFCLKDKWKKDPSISKALSNAVMEGWKIAALDQNSAKEAVRKRLNKAQKEQSIYHTNYMLNTILKSIIPDKKENWKIGYLKESDYNNCLKMLKSNYSDDIYSPDHNDFFKGRTQ